MTSTPAGILPRWYYFILAGFSGDQFQASIATVKERGEMFAKTCVDGLEGSLKLSCHRHIQLPNDRTQVQSGLIHILDSAWREIQNGCAFLHTVVAQSGSQPPNALMRPRKPSTRRRNLRSCASSSSDNLPGSLLASATVASPSSMPFT